MSQRNTSEAKAARRAERDAAELRDEVRRAQRMGLRTANPDLLLYAEYIKRVLATGRSYPNGYSLPVLGISDRCWTNAQVLAREHGWRYVEGMAAEPAKPGEYWEGWVEHGWCLDDNDTVVECTWEHWARRRYFGVVTPLPPLDQPVGLSPVHHPGGVVAPGFIFTTGLRR